MTVFAIVKLRMKKTQWNFRGILIDWVPGQGSGVWDFNLSNAVWCSWQENGSRRSMLHILEGTNLENVESIKYLGVTITSDLRWNTHVSNVCTKANRTLGFLRRNLYSCPQEEKLSRDILPPPWLSSPPGGQAVQAGLSCPLPIQRKFCCVMFTIICNTSIIKCSS